MARSASSSTEGTPEPAERQVEDFRKALGPFVVAVEKTRMAMLFTDAARPGHPILFANDSFVALTGYDRREVLARNIDFLFAGPVDARVRERIEAAVREAGTAELECRRKDGRVLPADVYISPVCDEAGNVIQHFWSFVDLTVHHERKLALERELSLQRELIHVSRLSAMGTMASTLAHELNQPLTAIANYAAAGRMHLARGEPGCGAVSEDLTAIEESALRAGAVISQLRNMTQRGPPSRELFDLNDAVREAAELVRAGSCEGVLIEDDVHGALMIEGDRVQIQQVVINLVRNGCEAAAGLPNGRVTVSTCVRGDQAIVSVDDNGPGVDASRSFDLFEGVSSTKPGGMGVGLSISRTIVEAHEGRIWLARRKNGRTRFQFSVPLTGAAAPDPPASRSPA